MIYKTIEVKFWNDKEIKKLSLEAKYLFIYLMTNRQVHHSGLYEMPLPMMLFESGLTENKFNKCMAELQAKPFVLYDPETELIWVVNMAYYSLKIGNRPNLIKGIGKQIGTLHKSFLINHFHNKYKDLGYAIPMGYEWVTDPSNIVIDIDMGIAMVIKEEDKPKNEVKHKYGINKNVLLTDKELESLKEKFSDWEKKIENISGYIGSKGDSYKSHYLTILNWSRKDGEVVSSHSVNQKDYQKGVSDDGTQF